MTSRHHAFEFFLRSACRQLAERDGDKLTPAQIEDVSIAARREYEKIRLVVPDIGGARNVFQPVMIVNGWIASLHRALAAQEQTASDTVAICHAVVDGWLRVLPGFALRGIGRLLLSAPSRAYFERQAKRSQERRYADDFVWKIERTEDGEFSMVFDECAVNKWYDAQGFQELKPYCNFFDVTYSRLMGMGLDASETIGLGCPTCALRFKHGRETQVPPTLAPVFLKR